MVKRYTQPVVQTVKGLEFKVEEVPLFLDPKGRWVEFADYHALSLQLANRTAELVAVQEKLAHEERCRLLHEGELRLALEQYKKSQERLAEYEQRLQTSMLHRDDLMARLAAAERYAGRYLWLRDESLQRIVAGPVCAVADKWGNLVLQKPPHLGHITIDGVELDAAIDGALKDHA